MAKLTPELRELVLARIAAGSSYEEAADWCGSEHRVSISKQAIGKLVSKHRHERADVSKAIARDHITRQLPKDLEVADAKLKQAEELLDLAAEDARSDPTVSNFEKYSKANQAYLAHLKRRDDTLGLNVPDDPTVDGVVGLLGLALDEEELAAEGAAFADDDADGDGAPEPH